VSRKGAVRGPLHGLKFVPRLAILRIGEAAELFDRGGDALDGGVDVGFFVEAAEAEAEAAAGGVREELLMAARELDRPGCLWQQGGRLPVSRPGSFPAQS
jgi:hypothetical protein